MAAGWGTSSKTMPVGRSGGGGMPDISALIAQLTGGGGGGGGVTQIPWGPQSTSLSSVWGSGGGMVPQGAGGGQQFSASYTSTPNPEIQSILEMMKARYGKAFEMPPELAAQYSEDNTKKLIGTATARINEGAAGQKARAAEIEARGGPGRSARGIEEAAQRRAAGATSDITADRARAKDSLATTMGGMRQNWQAMADSVLGAAGGLASSSAANQIAQQQLQQQGWQGTQDVAFRNVQSLLSLFSQLYN
jgi:hypothetical protein